MQCEMDEDQDTCARADRAKGPGRKAKAASRPHRKAPRIGGDGPADLSSPSGPSDLTDHGPAALPRDDDRGGPRRR